MSERFKKVLEDLQILIEDAEGDAFILGKQEGYEGAMKFARKARLEGFSKGYEEGSAGQAAEPKSKTESEHATSQEADAGLNEPPDFADLIGHLTEERRAKPQGV